MSGVYVDVYKTESLQKALKSFRRKVDASGVLGDYKRHQSFMSPGEKRRRRRLASQLQRQKARRS